MELEGNFIKIGDFVIVQRQNYTKLHKLKPGGKIQLGKDSIELDEIVGKRYGTNFQMMMKMEKKREYALEVVNDIKVLKNSSVESGSDNRNIIDDSTSQSLTKEQIEELRENSIGSSRIVEQLITNSKTFSQKTEYSQEKYMKKKQKKYFEFIQILRPNIRLLAVMFHRQEPSKTLGVRIDDLSQIMTYSNVHSESNCLLYDSGSSGLVAAAILNAIGRNTQGKLIHMHPGSECQKTAISAMQFPQELLDRCVNVNIYSVLRCFYQNKDCFSDNSTDNSDNSTDKCEKKRKLSEGELPVAKKPTWMYDNMKACKLLEEKVDSLIIVAKEDCVPIMKELQRFLRNGRFFVVFSLVREPLQDLYFFLKSCTDFKGLRLSNSFMRNYQVLPERTHPETGMNFGGFLLGGFKIEG